MIKVEVQKITNNLDRIRVPLNSMQRAEKETNPIYPYIGANNIMGYIDEYLFDEKILCVAEDGGSWGYQQTCAKIYNEKVWVNNHAHVLTAKDNLILEYLMYYLNYADLTLYINGATRGKLTKSSLNEIKIPLPPLDQQKKIAAILDAADAYSQKTKALIEKYDELTQSLFLDMFGDPVTNPKGWGKKTLVDIVSSKQYSLKRGPFGGSLTKEIFKETGYKVYEQKNAINKNVEDGKYFIDEIKYNEMKAFNVNPGDFIVSCSGTIGEIFQIPVGAPEGIINQALMKIKVNEELLLPDLFESLFTYYIKDNIFISGSKGSGLKNVSSMKIIKAERFIVPSIEFQKKYVDLKLNLKKQKAQAEASLAQAEDLFNSLLQRAFKGELTT